jgi:hypothetical protein
MQVDSPPDFRGLRGRDVIGLQLPLRQDRELILRVQMLPVGTMALGLAAGAPALEERAGEHLAQSAETADETTAQLQLRVAGHKGLLLN